jgi:RimK-like ATP-grasp domain
MPYNKSFYIAVNPVGSKFAKALQQALQSCVENKVFRALPNRVAQKAARFGRQYFSVTQRVLNKVEQFNAFTRANVSCPAFAFNAEAARGLGCRTLFARTLINATNGRGIVEFEASQEHYPVAPLYTEYIPKKAEYRFHVFGGEVIDVQQKRKKQGFDGERDTRIRNVHNGYVYCRDGITPPDGAANLAIRAVAACGYQYGAVDLIYNERRNQCYVLEVNSRPGLMGTTVEKYAEALIKMFNLKEKQ